MFFHSKVDILTLVGCKYAFRSTSKLLTAFFNVRSTTKHIGAFRSIFCVPKVLTTKFFHKKKYLQLIKNNFQIFHGFLAQSKKFVQIKPKQPYPSLRANGNTKPPRQKSTCRQIPELEANSPSSCKYIARFS